MLLFASGNRGKCGEAKELALECGVSLVSPFDLTASFCEQQGLPVPKGAPPQVDETGRTYEENAHLKAQAYFDWSGIPSVADDSGLEVVALGGEPGLYTARYAGEGCSPDENIQKLLMVLEGEQNRRALFICVLCLVGFDSPMFIRGELDGEIALK
ncbi:MAG: non-canonical purine NTP pyrophosphatase [Bdellovibrionales bacterium]|nr:non-canonical purine NTP pyrophosphatase [Bdellovibrionales bacterium]